MKQYIKKLQAKHEDTRKLIFTGTMIACMSIVGLVWFYSLGTRFDSKVKAQANEDIKPFKLFGKSISDTISNMSASVGKIPQVEVVIPQKEEKQIDLIPVEYSDVYTNTNPQ